MTVLAHFLPSVVATFLGLYGLSALMTATNWLRHQHVVGAGHQFRGRFQDVVQGPAFAVTACVFVPSLISEQEGAPTEIEIPLGSWNLVLDLFDDPFFTLTISSVLLSLVVSATCLSYFHCDRGMISVPRLLEKVNCKRASNALGVGALIGILILHMIIGMGTEAAQKTPVAPKDHESAETRGKLQ